MNDRHRVANYGTCGWLRRGRHAVALLTTALVSMFSTMVHADTESVSFGVNQYGTSGYCGGSDLDFQHLNAQEFMAATRDHAGYDAYIVWTGLATDWEDFVEGYGDEDWPYGTDWADVVFFGGHGAAQCQGSPRYGKLVAGDAGPGGICDIRLGGSTTNVKLAAGGADSDTNFLMMHSSESLKYCAADQLDGNIIDWVDEGESGTQLTLINGFHNSPIDEEENHYEIEDYIIAADVAGVGDDWVDLLALSMGDATDECTVSSVSAQNYITAESLYLYGGFNDWHDTGTHQHWAYFYDCTNDKCYDLPGC